MRQTSLRARVPGRTPPSAEGRIRSRCARSTTTGSVTRLRPSSRGRGRTTNDPHFGSFAVVSSLSCPRRGSRRSEEERQAQPGRSLRSIAELARVRGEAAVTAQRELEFLKELLAVSGGRAERRGPGVEVLRTDVPNFDCNVIEVKR